MSCERLRETSVHLTAQVPHGTLLLRPMTEMDWGVLLRWNSDPEVLYYSEGDDVKAYPLEAVKKMYRGVSQNASGFVMELNGMPIGECWLQKMNIKRFIEQYPEQDLHRIDLMIGEKEFWGQGIGTQVIRTLTRYGFKQEKADQIFACGIADYNNRSHRAFEKAGYTLVERTEEKPGMKAKYCFYMAITRDRYFTEMESR